MDELGASEVIFILTVGLTERAWETGRLIVVEYDPTPSAGGCATNRGEF